MMELEAQINLPIHLVYVSLNMTLKKRRTLGDPVSSKLPRCGLMHERYNMVTERLERVRCERPIWRSPKENHVYPYYDHHLCRHHLKQEVVRNQIKAFLSNATDEQITNPGEWNPVQCWGYTPEMDQHGNALYIPPHPCHWEDPWHYQVGYDPYRDNYVLVCRKCFSRVNTWRKSRHPDSHSKGRRWRNEDTFATINTLGSGYGRDSSPIDRARRWLYYVDEMREYGCSINQPTEAIVRQIEIRWTEYRRLAKGDIASGKINRHLNRWWIIDQFYKRLCPSCGLEHDSSDWFIRYGTGFYDGGESATCRSCSISGASVPFFRDIFPCGLLDGNWG